MKIGSEDLDAARTGAVWLPPVPGRVVAIRGPDARRFCNGMFTNNVRDLPVQGVQRSALVDDRARIGGFLELLCTGADAFLAVLDGISPEGFLERYERYVVFDDVTIEPEPERVLCSVQGPGARVVLGGLGLPVPEVGRYAEAAEVLGFGLRSSPAGGFALLVSAGAVEALAQRVAGEARAVSAEAAEVLRVLAGRPRFPEDTGDKRLPHELGLRDELLSFDKGCYIGQETINRVDVMGDVKRRLAGIRIPGGAELGSGARILVGGEAIGALTSPALLPDGDWVGLSIVRRPHDEPGTEVVVEEGGRERPGLVCGLPFSV